MRTAPLDQDVRDRILSARDRSLSIEAGAGTGKTTLLVDRVLALLRRGHLLHRLAIITFTRKAAADLSRKLRRELTLYAGEEPLRQALTELEHASIGTTDSFCRSLLSDFAIEAGIAPGFAVADEIAQQVLAEKAWTRLLARSMPAHFESASVLREAGVTLAELRKVAEIAVSNRDLPIAPIAAAPLDPVLPRVRSLLDRALALGAQCTDSKDKLLLHLRELDRWVREAQAIGEAGADRHLLSPRGGLAIVNHHGRADFWGFQSKELVREILEQIEEILDAGIRERGARAAVVAREWVRDYAREYEDLKRERGILDFRDLALRTRDLLRDREDIRVKLAARFDEILLDEAQDTDPLQMEIAFFLAARTPNRSSPIESTLEPGKLFLVGDPKQSIYRFRRADIELYERARQRFAAIGGAETIQANFRSHTDLLDFVNRLFRGWMVPSEEESIQARYVDLLPGNPAAAAEGAGGARILAVVPDSQLAVDALAKSGRDSLNAALVHDVEIDALARAIRRILGRDGSGEAWIVNDPTTGEPRPARPGDIAVLVRRIERGDPLRDALLDCGIPALVAGGKRFAAREEIAALSTVLRAVADPLDGFARFAALRSSAFGFDDDALTQHTLGVLDSAHPCAAGITRALSLLDDFAARARMLPVPELLEKIVEDLSLVSLFGLRRDGRLRADALRMLIEAADSLEEAGFSTLRDFSDWLSAQEAETQNEGPGELEDEEERTVQILTMHKSKGLEFPVVILADLGMRLQTKECVVARRVDGFLEARFSSREQKVETAGFEQSLQEEDARRKAEDVRLLYVAMTRARDFLLLSWMPNKEGFLGAPMLQTLAGAEPGSAPAESSPMKAMLVESLPSLPEGEAISPVNLDRARRQRPPSSLAAWREGREQARRGARIVRATSSTLEEGSRVVQEDLFATVTPFSGPSFGDVVHKCLELYDPAGESPVETALRRAFEAISGGRPGATRDWVLQWRAHDRDAVLRDLERLVCDPALLPIWRARRARREVPFLLPVGGDFLSGTVDVLIEAADGTLSIADFKTDRMLSIKKSLSPRHRRQALLTAFALQEITKRVVREFRFLFLATEPVTTVSVPISSDEISEARSLLQRLRLQNDGAAFLETAPSQDVLSRS